MTIFEDTIPVNIPRIVNIMVVQNALFVSKSTTHKLLAGLPAPGHMWPEGNPFLSITATKRDDPGIADTSAMFPAPISNG